MRAACCEATVLRNEVIAPDIRLLTVVWPDRDHAPHAGQFFTLRAWGADEAPFLSRPISVHRWNPDSSTIEFLYQVVGEGTEKLAQLKQQAISSVSFFCTFRLCSRMEMAIKSSPITVR